MRKPVGVSLLMDRSASTKELLWQRKCHTPLICFSNAALSCHVSKKILGKIRVNLIPLMQP